MPTTSAFPARTSAVARVKAPATCGEFVQGHIDGEDFLINCPIDLFSYATVQRIGEPGIRLIDLEFFTKIQQGIAMIAERIEVPLQHEIAIRSHIPRGKGMASSTADLTAALSAISEGCGLRMSLSELSYLITRIEPSDCVHLPGISHVNHLTGRLHECLEAPGDISVVVVDCGGEVDTVAFDREHARAVYRAERTKIMAARSMLKRGLRVRDEALVGMAATMSAEISQKILHKAPFDELLACTRELGALGVNCAHSGTVLGVMHRTSEGIGRSLIEAIARRFAGELTILGDFHVISGGCVEY